MTEDDFWAQYIEPPQSEESDEEENEPDYESIAAERLEACEEYAIRCETDRYYSWLYK